MYIYTHTYTCEGSMCYVDITLTSNGTTCLPDRRRARGQTPSLTRAVPACRMVLLIISIVVIATHVMNSIVALWMLLYVHVCK